MKKLLSILMAIVMVTCLLAGCGGGEDTTPTKTINIGGNTTGSTAPTGSTGNPTDPTDPTDPTGSTGNPTDPTGSTGGTLAVEDIKGITDTTIYVGNTAATTGAYAAIGEPFNLGIQAAFAAYNANGGFYGLNVELINYDDGGDAAQSVTYMNQLVHDDEVFAIVGNFGSYAVAANLDIMIDANVPMVYAAAGNDILFNDSAEDGERAIFPVQPLCYTEGQMLILRAFAPNDKGGMGGTKVGVLTNNDEASQTMLSGIKYEANNSGLTSKIVYQNVSGDDYSAAINALKEAGCDVVVYASSTYFTTALLAMSNAQYYPIVLTTYNNSSATILNNGNLLKAEYEDVLANIQIFAQAWLDITSTDYVFDLECQTELGQAYKTFYALFSTEYTGVTGFNEAYWEVAQAIYAYCAGKGRTDALQMSYNSYALAGYIAGDLFCQGLTALQASGKDLTRANFIDIMESQEFQIAMAGAMSFADGMRSGVQSFALTWFYDLYDYNGGLYHSASSMTVSGLISIEEFRAMLKEG